MIYCLPTFEDVAKNYDDSARTYHNRGHLNKLLSGIGIITTAQGVPRPVHLMLELCAVYHDAVYVVGAQPGDNEHASINLLRGHRERISDWLQSYVPTGLSPKEEEHLFNAVKDVIEATAHYADRDEQGRICNDRYYGKWQRLFLNLDLLTLGHPELCATASVAVKDEAMRNGCTSGQFEIGRAQFLRRMLVRAQHPEGFLLNVEGIDCGRLFDAAGFDWSLRHCQTELDSL